MSEDAPSNSMDYIYNVHDLMKTNDLILVYEGEFTQDITKVVLYMAERNLEKTNEESTIKKKVFNVMVECLQNICKHSDEMEGEDDNTAVFMIGKKDNQYMITSGNCVYNENINIIKEKIDEINNLDRDGLKQLYKESMKNSRISDKGGAGLGLIDMARKSGNKLEYDFKKLNDNISFFSLQTKIARVSRKEYKNANE